MSEQEEYKLTYIKDTTEGNRQMSSNLYKKTKDFHLLKDWVNQEGEQIQPPDPDPNKPKKSKQEEYKLTYIKDTTEKGRQMSSNLYKKTKDFRLLKDWINQEGEQKQPPPLRVIYSTPTNHPLQYFHLSPKPTPP